MRTFGRLVAGDPLIAPRRAALAGVAGPVLFGGGLVALTALQFGFMLRIGWEPLEDPSGAWPSGLALGPHGWVQDLDFAFSGALLAFETDPIDRTGPRTLHGWVHDASFVLFVLVPTLFLLWRRMREDRLWRGHARYTFVTAMLATGLHFLPGVAYYLFLVVVLVWFAATAIKLWRRGADYS